MLTHLLEPIGRLERALARGEAGDAGALVDARHALRVIERGVVAHCYVDGDVEVEPHHRAAAIEIVTAYLDGALRGDDFELLATVVADRMNRDGGEPSFVVAVIAALARLCGDLAGMEEDGSVDRRRGLAAVQAIAANGEH